MNRERAINRPKYVCLSIVNCFKQKVWKSINYGNLDRRCQSFVKYLCLISSCTKGSESHSGVVRAVGRTGRYPSGACVPEQITNLLCPSVQEGQWTHSAGRRRHHE